MKYPRSLLAVLAALLVCAAFTACAESTRQMTMDITLSDLGDATTVVTLKFTALADYNRLKTIFGSNPMVLVRQLIGNRGKSQFEKPNCTFDDGAMTVKVSATELGAARNKADFWLVDAGDGRLRTQQQDLFMFDLDIPLENNLKETSGYFTAAVNLRVPAKAQNPTYSAAKKRVEYTLAPGGSPMRGVWIGCAGLFLVLAVLPFRFARKPPTATPPVASPEPAKPEPTSPAPAK